jgi:hypothetical protein
MPDIPLHQPTGTLIWKLWRRASRPFPFRAKTSIGSSMVVR